MGWLNPVDPGAAGYIIGGLLIVGAVKWLRFAVRRFRAEVAAEHGPAVGRVRVPQGYWHPSMGPRREPVTEMLPRCADRPDATMLIPRQRAVRRG
ncbi:MULTISPECIES: hypothetical protein [unclassified Micromonospora]|uniref:hypothetical protein n=1 Tax=unclassified Micromonospora TaxID=2617518 RepID=UPI00332A7F5C